MRCALQRTSIFIVLGAWGNDVNARVQARKQSLLIIWRYNKVLGKSDLRFSVRSLHVFISGSPPRRENLRSLTRKHSHDCCSSIRENKYYLGILADLCYIFRILSSLPLIVSTCTIHIIDQSETRHILEHESNMSIESSSSSAHPYIHKAYR